MKLILSLNNPEIKAVASLQIAKYRKAQNQTVAEGIRTCKTLIDAGITPINLYATSEMLDEAHSLAKDILITEVSSDVMNKMSGTTSPSGILMTFAIPQAPSLEKLSPGVVLAQINDPGNMGTLIRTAAAMNINTVVCIEGCDPWSPKVIQATAGTIGLLNIFQISWQTLINHKANLHVCALVVKDGKRAEELELKNSLLVVGSEAHGIPEEWIAQCDQKLTIPMPGHIESLNAAIAGSIALYVAFNK